MFGKALVAIACAPLLFAQPQRELLNGKEVGREIHFPAGTESGVKEFFPSFFEYQDLMLFHPRIGYYSAGLVDFQDDFSTYPNTLAPFFGHMIAEQAYRMWAGMRKAGTLSATEQFTIAEFGAGNGALAESILEYINHRPEWQEFARQLIYACYDRSPTMNQAQRNRNWHFGKQFEARQEDATGLNAKSLKGLILSNEMLDNFSVHKVILSPTGSAEVAFVVPVLSAEAKPYLSEGTLALVEKDNRTIKGRLSADDTRIYLSRAALVSVLESLSKSRDYRSRLKAIQFFEIYLPARLVPELAGDLSRNARYYAHELAKVDKGIVAYINLGESKYMHAAGAALAAGYVITIDYGSSWDGLTAFGPYGKLRTYGPGSVKEKPDPYAFPTQNDITTDINFGHMAEEGKPAGLKPVYFGYQRAIETGTQVSLDHLPTDHQLTDRQVTDFKTWSFYFRTVRSFKVLVQQKEGTDPAYSFPDRNPLPLGIDDKELTPAQRKRASGIEAKLTY